MEKRDGSTNRTPKHGNTSERKQKASRSLSTARVVLRDLQCGEEMMQPVRGLRYHHDECHYTEPSTYDPEKLPALGGPFMWLIPLITWSTFFMMQATAANTVPSLRG